MKKNKLLLFANSKHREQYILDNFINDTVDTTNFTTLSNFFNILFNRYKSINRKDILNSDFSIFYIKQSIEEYKKNNKDSVFIKQPDYYSLSSNIYSLYSELLISKFLSGDDNFFDSLRENKNISDMLAIINIYKLKLEKEKKIDEIILYYNFIKALNKNEIDFGDMLNYSTIEIIGFENLAYKYLAFLTALKNGYNKNITVVLPYESQILGDYKKNIADFGIEIKKEISAFALSIINASDKIKNYKNNIAFIAGFGMKQECYSAIDKIIELVKSGEALYDIAIVFDSVDYHDLIAERLYECNIDYEERLGTPLWQIPVIPIITSIFSVINTFERDREVNIEELIKIFSSAYVSIEGLDNSKVRSILYNSTNMFEIMPEKNFEGRLTKQYDDVNVSATCSIVHDIYKLIKDISYSKSFIDITNTYKLLLRKFNLAKTIEKNKLTCVRDNNALAEFVEKINELSNLEIETDYKDYYTVLNIMLRDARLNKKTSMQRGISLLSSYDARGLSFKHLVLVGANGNLFSRKAETFILGKQLRENINKKYNKNIIATVSESNVLSSSFFYNVVSNLKEDSHIYFSFRYKDNNGSLELPSVFVEEIFYAITEKPFNFENLKEYGAIFRKDYIPKDDLIHTEKEALISLFYHKKMNNKLPKNILEINNSMLQRNSDSENKDILKAVCKEIFSNPLSVSDIEDMLTCGQRFVENKMFTSFDTTERTIGINHGTRGEIYHHCFCELFKRIKLQYGFPFNANKILSYKDIILEIIDSLEQDKYYRLYDEKKADKESLKDEIKISLNLYIEKEINRLQEDSSFVPALFEEGFNDYTLYKTKSGIEIKLKGRIDRIDFHYDSDNNIDGLRIVDYKSKGIDIKAESFSDNTQLLLYIDFAISKYLENKKTSHLEIAYCAYSYEHLLNTYFFNFSDTQAILNILDINNKESVKANISVAIENMLSGDVSYSPSANNCSECQKRNRCTNAYSD